MPAYDQKTALADFLARHVKPYDLVNDAYDRPPFAADIKEGKNDPIYNAHSYHTKVPPRSIIPYILHYTKPGDVVLDPFCGSGMTGVAARMCANPPTDLLEQYPELKGRVGPRACILNDLSPAACHIAYNYNTPVDVEALRSEFERIEAAVKDEFNWLYGTEHYEPAIAAYDLASAHVAGRLKNPPSAGNAHTLFTNDQRTWELLTKAEVEVRLGYPVTELPRDKSWGDVNIAEVEHWVCIPATIQYTIWSDVYRCEGFVAISESTGKISARGKNAGKPIMQKKRVARGCGNEIVLWDVAIDPQTGELKAEIVCAQCGQTWKKSSLKRLRAQAVSVCYEYETSSSKTRRSLTRATQRQTDFLQHLAARKVPYWVPDTPWEETREMWRGGHRDAGIALVSDFFTKRNLWALARLWHEVDQAPKEIEPILRFWLTGLIQSASRMNRYKPGFTASILMGTLYVGSFVEESSFYRLMPGRTRKVLELADFLKRAASHIDTVIMKGSASLLPLPDRSVDFVFADPPFGSNIFYSDCSVLWESWLGEFTDMSLEAVWNKSVRPEEGGKTLNDYERLMAGAFEEMFRVLKPNRWAAVEFNNSDGRVFDVIKRAICQAGFKIVNMLLLDKEQKTFKQVKGAEGIEDVVDKDVLFNLHKPAVALIDIRLEDHDLEQQVADAVREHLQVLPERIKADAAKYNDEHRTTATINSMLMNTLIPKGVAVERLNLPFIERVCSRYFRKIGQRWYLRGEAAGGNGANGLLIAEEATISDELTAIAWLRQRLQLRPILIGELKPLWMRATGLLPAEVSRSLVLENLLTENFWRDLDTNRWREPTPEERDRMNDDRSQRVLHDAERFVNGALRRGTTDEERCDWIDVLYQACRAIEDNEMDALPALRGFDKPEAYALIPRLFQSILRDGVPSDAYTRAEKQARAASQRVQKQVQEDQVTKATSRAKGDAGQGKLDFKKTT